MNKNEIETFNDLKQIVEHVAKVVDNIDITLNGKPDDHTSEGLVGAVNNNIKWKNTVNKWMGILGISTFGLLLKEGFNFLKRG